MHETTRVSIRVKPKNTRFRDSGHKGLRKRGLQGFLRAGGSSNEIFAHTRASAEKVGDIEFWLGVLDVANVTMGLVDVFEVNTDPADFLNGLEKALRGFGSVSRATSTINDKRRGSFDCTLQPAEADEVLRILNGIPDYESLRDFNCMTDHEAAFVIEEFHKKKGMMTSTWVMMRKLNRD